MAAQSTAEASRPILLDPSEGEALWFNNDLLTFKATGPETGGAFLVVEEVARRGKVTPLHAHPEEEETFYILEGGAFPPRRRRAVARCGRLRLGAARGSPRYLVTSEVTRALIVITPGNGAME